MHRHIVAAIAAACVFGPLARIAIAQAPPTLTLSQAEERALANQPLVHAADALANAADAQTRETKSTLYPVAYGSLTGVDALNNTRIGAGGLNNPVIYDRLADGITVGQVITDFGRTGGLVKSANLHDQAQHQAAVTTRAEVVLRVDTAYFAALWAQAVLRVADETVQQRQLSVDQITALANNGFKTDLDVSFAAVDLAQARLLRVQSQGDVEAAFADLSFVLGEKDRQMFTLVDAPTPAAPAADAAPLIATALQARPELVGLRLNATAEDRFAEAEGDLSHPTISAVASFGMMPFHQDTLSNRYAAAGFNVNVPIFNGHLFGARQSEAAARASAAHDQVRDAEDRIARDVRVAWLDATTAFQKLSLTDQLVSRATEAQSLAQSRYDIGLSTIVELSQAQLNLTQAQIAQASARYDYAARLAALNFAIGR